DAEGISIVSHVGRPDERLHELGQHEIMVIVQGPHGYISPGWYEDGEFVPTWNHITAHLYGTPQILSDEENFRVLADLVDFFEERMPQPVSLEIDEQDARHIATGTVGLRLRVTRFDARAKLSQNKTPEVVGRIIEQLEHGENYAQPALAAEMRRVHDR
ncbi:MAG: transcriptional regulator, partial [Microbacteriaceae bacterium]|nr:transcriptional regulator [Microbacteriaceae bacterium]